MRRVRMMSAIRLRPPKRRGFWPGGAHDEHGALDVADLAQRAEPAPDVGERRRAGLLAGGGQAEQRPARGQLRGAAGLGHPEAAVAVLGAAHVVGGAGGARGRGEQQRGQNCEQQQARQAAEGSQATPSRL